MENESGEGVVAGESKKDAVGIIFPFNGLGCSELPWTTNLNHLPKLIRLS